jgi:inner membrane protein
MYLLAHTGITLGAARVVEQAVNRPWFRVDYRFILLGSLLPDIVDKPLGIVIFPEAIGNGRTFLHTMIFLVMTILLGAFVYRWKNALWGFFIAFGVLMHFSMDAMWTDPVTLYWPFIKPAFDKYPDIELLHIVRSWVYTLQVEPRIFLPELAGLVILLIFAIRIITEKRVMAFIMTGYLVAFLAVFLNLRFLS